MSDQEDYREMVDEVAKQDGVIVIRIIEQVVTEDSLDNNAWSCSWCDSALQVGATVWLAGIPTGKTMEEIQKSTLVSLPCFHSQECLQEYLDDWGQDIDYEDLLTAYYG